jgi:hypothetical protein
VYRSVFAEKQQFPRILIENIKNITLPKVNVEYFEKIKKLVNTILKTKINNPQADTSAQESEIDRLIYALYDLTEEEIKITEKM